MTKVLVVDDSSFMRKTISRMLEKEPSITVVGTAADGMEALEKIETLKPDVVTLDIEMPRLNGIETLKRIMATKPLPVIMMSALTQEGAEITIEALHLGASDFMAKDHSNVSFSLMTREEELINKVKTVAKRKVFFLSRRLEAMKRPLSVTPAGKAKHEILAVGASTGGPPALQVLLSAFPKDFPVPIVIAQHMPKIFTQSFAQRLNSLAHIEIREAENGETLEPGVALIAPGDSHMSLKRTNGKVAVEFVEKTGYIYRPSVDLLMQSTAEVFQSKAVGVILTGMGSDGLAGLKELKARNGYVIAQDEETCVVYGMPKAVVTARIADAVLPIDKISEEIIRVL